MPVFKLCSEPEQCRRKEGHTISPVIFCCVSRPHKEQSSILEKTAELAHSICYTCTHNHCSTFFSLLTRAWNQNSYFSWQVGIPAPISKIKIDSWSTQLYVNDFRTYTKFWFNAEMWRVIQCTLDIATSLRHGGWGRCRQGGRYLCNARAPSSIGVEVAISSAAAISKVAISNGHCT